jgi:hypothetical protein
VFDTWQALVRVNFGVTILKRRDVMLRGSKASDKVSGEQFQSITQRECHARVGIWLETLYGQSAITSLPSNASYTVAVGSALTLVRIVAFQNDVAIQIASRVVSNANLTQDLLVQLLMENFSELPFASFALTENGDIWLTRLIMGNCSVDDFATSISGVADMADEYDDVIRTHWGGERAIDRTN